ncbi:hypothetical protein [Thermococcus sp.]
MRPCDVYEGCNGGVAPYKVHTHTVPEGRTSRVNIRAMAVGGALAICRTGLGVNNFPPALAQARAVGVIE